jgi:hypothetical protein
MGFRRWVSWVAVAAILLHTVTIARHYVILLEAIPLELAAGNFDPAAFCHTAIEADGSNGSDRGTPSQDGSSKPCPICQGAASAYALTASEAPAPGVPRVVFVERLVLPSIKLVPAARFCLPLTRGPPSIA